MTCTHTEETLAWLYGEGDESHLAHVGACSICQALVADHEQVLAAVALGNPASSPEVLPISDPIQGANRPLWTALFAALPLAAAMLFVFKLWSPSAPTLVPDLPSEPVPVASVDFPDDLDWGLDDLDAELDDLFVDLEAL